MEAQSSSAWYSGYDVHIHIRVPGFEPLPNFQVHLPPYAFPGR